MATNLFVIRTPLQLFNAIEARDRLHSDEQNHLLLYYRKRVDKDQMLSLLDNHWHSVQFLKFRGLRQLFYPLCANWLTRKLPSIDTFYMGLISNVPLHLANHLRPQRLRLLDDGNETLLQARQVEQWRIQPQTRPESGLKHRLLGRKLSRACLQTLQYFTLYHPDNVPAERLIHNDYRSFSHRQARQPKTEEICFIGSNLVPQYLTEANFLALISAVRDHYGNRPIQYCAHRYESDALLAAVEARGMKVRRNSTILEAAFIQQGSVPGTVATFRSTAIDTLYQLYGCRREVFTFDLTRLAQPAQQSEFSTLLDSYQQAGISIRQLGV